MNDSGKNRWRDKLDELSYRVTREGATEPPFTGRYVDEKTPGTYACVCCGATLFRSEHKYDSGSGWPSFFRPAGENAVATARDESMGMIRTEIRCPECDAHLGHLFEDGPEPTGQRFCVNSASLNLKPDGSERE